MGIPQSFDSKDAHENSISFDINVVRGNDRKDMVYPHIRSNELITSNILSLEIRLYEKVMKILSPGNQPY